MLPPAVSPEVWLFAGAGAVSLLAFTVLILIPAVSGFGRSWEKLTAGFLSIFVLAVLVLLGVALGITLVYLWPRVT